MLTRGRQKPALGSEAFSATAQTQTMLFSFFVLPQSTSYLVNNVLSSPNVFEVMFLTSVFPRLACNPKRHHLHLVFLLYLHPMVTLSQILKSAWPAVGQGRMLYTETGRVLE